MSKIITLRKGLDINLQGKAVEKLVKLPLAPEYAVSPLDFEGVTTEKQVNKEATQALIDSRTAWDKYLSSQKYVASAEEAARQMEQRYNLGAATVVD